MSAVVEMLDVVDQDGDVLYQASRKEIHAKGLLHREIHIWLYTPQGEIIFQHRSKTKDLYPDTLGTSVGGHVDVGESYEHAALREMNEELGIKLLSIDELYFLMTLSTSYVDPISKMTNNSRRNVYAFPYLGDIADLKIEPGESQGFVLKPVQYMFSLTDAEKAKIQMNLASPEYRPVFETILGLVS